MAARSRKSKLDIDNLPDWLQNPDYVTPSWRAKSKNLKGFQDELNSIYGAGAWTDLELDKLIVEKRHGQIDRTYQGTRELESRREAHEAQVQAIVDEYLSRFKHPTPNDLVCLREMGRLQLLLGLLNEKQAELATSEDKFDADSLKIISTVRKDALDSFQKLEKSLGIDRLAREEVVDTVTLLDGIKKRAYELLAKRSRKIICPHCSADGKIEVLGIIIWHLDANHVQFNFQARCPVCDNMLVVNNVREVTEYHSAQKSVSG